MPAEVLLIEPLGADTLITIKSEMQKFVVRVIGASFIRLGDRAGLTWHSNDHHIFEGDSGKRLT